MLTRASDTTLRLPVTDLARFPDVHTIVILPSDSANLDAVVARTRADEAVLEAASVFIDRAGRAGGPGGVQVG